MRENNELLHKEIDRLTALLKIKESEIISLKAYIKMNNIEQIEIALKEINETKKNLIEELKEYKQKKKSYAMNFKSIKNYYSKLLKQIK